MPALVGKEECEVFPREVDLVVPDRKAQELRAQKLRIKTGFRHVSARPSLTRLRLETQASFVRLQRVGEGAEAPLEGLFA